MMNTGNRQGANSERPWSRRLFFDRLHPMSSVHMQIGIARILPLIFLLFLTAPADAMQDEYSIILTVPVIMSSINSQKDSPPDPINSTDCSNTFENGTYFKVCETKSPDGSLIYGEQLSFQAFDGGQGIYHHYKNSNLDYLNYNRFYYQINSRVDKTIQSLDWVVEVVKFEVPEGSTIKCYALGTDSPSPPGKVVVLVEWIADEGVTLREWPIVTCNDAPFYNDCNNTIKTMGYMDQCQQAALNQQPYNVLRSFPGNCNEAWRHYDEKGVLQECQLP